MIAGSLAADITDTRQLLAHRFSLRILRGIGGEATFGANYARQSQQVSAISSGTIENYVNRYCSEKPTGDFGDAILRLSDQFSGRNAILTK